MTAEEEIEQESPTEFEFVVCVDGQSSARVFGPREKRNWVLWKLSKYVVAFSVQGRVTVNRLQNGVWENDCDWRKLAH